MMTTDEKKQREVNVKGMKKNFKDFKARYGDRAESVLYSTATKNAMAEEDASDTPVIVEGERSEFSANQSLGGQSGPRRKYSLRRGSQHVSGHDSEGEALDAWKKLGDNKGVKIVRESLLDAPAEEILPTTKQSESTQLTGKNALQDIQQLTHKD